MVTPENRSQSKRAKMRETAKSPGEQLRQAREAIGASLSVVAARTRISETTLFHLEHDMYDEFAVELFLKGHLRSYAREVGLDSEAIIQSYEKYVGGAPILPSLDSASYLSDYTDSNRIESSQPETVTADTPRYSSSSSIASPFPIIAEPKISDAAISGKHRKVIGRNTAQTASDNIRRGPSVGRPTTGSNPGVRFTKPLFSIADRIFSKPSAELTTAEASAPIIRQRLNGASPSVESGKAGKMTGKPLMPMRQTTLPTRPDAIQPRSKLDRAIPQLKQFGAKHYIAIIAIIVLSVITAGLLAGNRADAQDPAKFPKNSQDTWELERQADQTRWLLEQPDDGSAKRKGAE